MLQHAKEKVIQYNEYEKKYDFPTSTVRKLERKKERSSARRSVENKNRKMGDGKSEKYAL